MASHDHQYAAFSFAPCSQTAAESGVEAEASKYWSGRTHKWCFRWLRFYWQDFVQLWRSPLNSSAWTVGNKEGVRRGQGKGKLFKGFWATGSFKEVWQVPLVTFHSTAWRWGDWIQSLSLWVGLALSFFCGGVAMIFTLDVICKLWDICSWVGQWLAGCLHCIFFVFSFWCDVFIFAGHRDSIAFGNLHLTVGDLKFTTWGHKDVFIVWIWDTTIRWGKSWVDVFCFSCLSAIHSNHPQTGVITLLVPTYSPTTLSVGFTGLALCSYTECCGLGGWVGLSGWMRYSASAVRDRFALIWKVCKLWKHFSPSRIFQMSDFLFAKFTVLTDVATLFGDNFIWIHLMELRWLLCNHLLCSNRVLCIFSYFNGFFTSGLRYSYEYSSTGLIVLSAHPAHPFCGGVAMIFTLDVICKLWDICSWVGQWLAGCLHCIFFVFSFWCDVFIFAGHRDSIAFGNLHLTVGDLKFTTWGHKDVFIVWIWDTTIRWGKSWVDVFCFSCLSAIHSNHPQTGVITLLVPTYSPTTLSVGEDVYSPASSSAVVKLLPCMALSDGFVKDGGCQL